MRPALGIGLISVSLAAAVPVRPSPAPDPDAVLFIVLDAVPYSTALAVRDGADCDEPLFAGFHAPVPLVSTFPSTTAVAFAEIFADFGLQPAPGYESRFFDWERRRKVGGGPISYFRISFPWRDFFDWKRKGVMRSAFGAARPVSTSIKVLRRALDEFVQSDQAAFFAYVGASDAAAHLRGPGELESILVELDRLLTETRARRADRPFVTVILSDHGIDGGEPLVNVRSGVKSALREAGFSLGSRLLQAGDAVVTPFGLISSFYIYTFEQEREPAALAAASAPGVDLCAFATGEGWSVVDAQGSGRSRRRPGPDGPEWSYVVEGEDPLEIEALFAEPARADGGWMADVELFEATADGRYPDPLHRIAHAFELVENPASVICSAAPGHMYGMRKTELTARFAKGPLRWTHGALYREPSLGFLMTDAPGWEPNSPVRARRALEPFAGAQR